MLVFYSYGVQFHQLISSDFLPIELARGFCSTDRTGGRCGWCNGLQPHGEKR